MKKERCINATGIALAILLVAATVSYAADKKFEKKFTVSPGGVLTVSTDVGTITIVGTPGNEVRVVADIEGKGHDVNEYEVAADQTATGVEVKGHGRKGGFWPWSSSDLDVKFRIEVPHEYGADVKTAGGSVSVSSIKGKLLGGTSGGDIVITDVEGYVNMETSGGDIRGEKVRGDMNVGTSGGNVVISTVTGAVDASTSGGNVQVSDIDGKVRAQTSGGNVRVKVTGANRGIHAETSGGNIEIVVPKEVAATIDASTSGGEVICDLPVTTSGRIREGKVQGTVNGGGSVIYAHTSGGDVRIMPAK